jgi:hypothetical protein
MLREVMTIVGGMCLSWKMDNKTGFMKAWHLVWALKDAYTWGTNEKGHWIIKVRMLMPYSMITAWLSFIAFKKGPSGGQVNDTADSWQSMGLNPTVINWLRLSES